MMRKVSNSIGGGGESHLSGLSHPRSTLPQNISHYALSKPTKVSQRPAGAREGHFVLPSVSTWQALPETVCRHLHFEAWPGFFQAGEEPRPSPYPRAPKPRLPSPGELTTLHSNSCCGSLSQQSLGAQGKGFKVWPPAPRPAHNDPKIDAVQIALESGLAIHKSSENVPILLSQ